MSAPQQATELMCAKCHKYPAHGQLTPTEFIDLCRDCWAESRGIKPAKSNGKANGKTESGRCHVCGKKAMTTDCSLCEEHYMTDEERAISAEQVTEKIMGDYEAVTSIADAIPPFPEECLCGRLGELARLTNMPLGVAYPAVVTAFSVLPTSNEFGARNRPNLYCCIICPPGGGKNETIFRAIDVVEVPYGSDVGGWEKITPGGDRQLMEVVGDKPGRKKGDARIPGPHKLLMVNMEIADVMKKCAYEKSTLASRLCDLWDDGKGKLPDRAGLITCDCRLSWIGGLPATVEDQERFLELFNAESCHGLYQRFVFGYTEEEWLHSDWEYKRPVVDLETAVLAPPTPYCMGFTPEAKEMYEAWRLDVPGFGRIRYNMKKFALLTAAADGQDRCDVPHLQKAILWAEWEAKVRARFKPSQAMDGNREALFANIILEKLERAGAESKVVNWKVVTNHARLERKIDPSLQLRAVKSLIDLGTLIALRDDDGNPTNKVMIRSLDPEKAEKQKQTLAKATLERKRGRPKN